MFTSLKCDTSLKCEVDNLEELCALCVLSAAVVLKCEVDSKNIVLSAVFCVAAALAAFPGAAGAAAGAALL